MGDMRYIDLLQTVRILKNILKKKNNFEEGYNKVKFPGLYEGPIV